MGEGLPVDVPRLGIFYSLTGKILFPNLGINLAYGVSRFNGARSCNALSMMSTVMPSASAMA